MSQINDALKKARQAQANAPVRESAPQLRSPETDHPVRTGPALIVPALIVVVGLAGAGLVWVAMSGRKPDAQKVGPVAAANLPPPSPKPEPVLTHPREVVSAPPVVSPAVTTGPEPKPAVVSPPPTVTIAPVAPPAASTLAPPATPKLNGIFFNPTRPTAIVNNKLVSTGSRVGVFTVLAITQNSVTLVGGGQTNVLSLSE